MNIAPQWQRENVEQAFEMGLRFHQSGNIQEAERVYRQILDADPQNAEALQLLGVAAHQTQRNELAIELIDKALSIRPDFAMALYNRGLAMQALNRPHEAIASYEKVLTIDAGMTEALVNRGVCFYELQRLDEALASYAEALTENPDFVPALTNRGISLQALGNHEEALASYEKALSIEPENADALYNRGISLQALARHEDAVASFNRAIALEPDMADAFTNRGVSLQALGSHIEAIASYDKALSLKSGDADAHFNQGHCELSLGAFDSGWRGYKWRWQSESARTSIGFPRHQWLANLPEDLASGDGGLLIWGEAGIGDKILFSSMLSDASALCGQAIVETDGRLTSLLQRAHPDIKFVPETEPSTLKREFPALRWQIPIGDLGGILRRELKKFPDRAAYLSADVFRARQIRITNDINTGSPVIGLSWRSKNIKTELEKSLTLPDFLPLTNKCKDAVFVSLQYGDVAAEIDGFTEKFGSSIVSLKGVDLFADMEDLAAAISICDLVVTCSNVTAHMACALGKETIVLVPGPGTRAWYWGARGATTPWYPTAKLFTRPACSEEWDIVIETVRARFNERPVTQS